MFLQQLTVLLGSASPRRRDLLSQLGCNVVVRTVDVDERQLPGETPNDYIERIVLAKLKAVEGLSRPPPHDAVVVADTIVSMGNEILQKPVDDSDARRMLREMAGREHRVTTRFAVVGPQDPPYAESVSTRVFVRAMTDDEIDVYIRSGEGRDKAGAYAIQGLGGAFIPEIRGSYGAVVGLPLCEVGLALSKISIRRVG